MDFSVFTFNYIPSLQEKKKGLYINLHVNLKMYQNKYYMLLLIVKQDDKVEGKITALFSINTSYKQELS